MAQPDDATMPPGWRSAWSRCPGANLFPPHDLAITHLAPGNEGRVFELLGAAVRDRSPRAAFPGVDPRFDGLRGDARFRALLQPTARALAPELSNALVSGKPIRTSR
jgi:hypothetical protein